LQRNTAQLANKIYDLLVIGGGIHGACIAWDATLRGLSVALVEKGDFGQATSANSLKIIHGGLRYLQDGNLKLMRTMIRERTTWMRIAPHLVHPLPCLMPTTKKPTRNRPLLAAALTLTDAIGYDRNRLADPQKHLPQSRTLSRAECLHRLPGLPAESVTGGALWYDAQMYNSERLLLSFVQSAANAGAQVANYVRVTNLIYHRQTVRGVTATDELSGQSFDIRARLVINSSGAWVDSILGSLNGQTPSPQFHLSTAMNLVTRQIIPRFGAGVTSNYHPVNGSGRPIHRSRMLFVVPWRGYSLIGTAHAPYAGPPQQYRLAATDIQEFVDEINTAYPGAALTLDDVYHVHHGFLPAAPHHRAGSVKLVREGRICDHEKEDGMAGLITVVGVKYTTARHVAQQTVDLAVQKLGQTAPPCRTHTTALFGGQIAYFQESLAQAIQQRPAAVSPNTIQHLVYNYGSDNDRLLRYIEQTPAWGQPVSPNSPVTKAEIIHAVRAEMAQKLTDVVQRRTELGAAGHPGDRCLKICAGLMAAELNWSEAQKQQEIEAAHRAYPLPKVQPLPKTGATLCSQPY